MDGRACSFSLFILILHGTLNYDRDHGDENNKFNTIGWKGDSKFRGAALTIELQIQAYLFKFALSLNQTETNYVKRSGQSFLIKDFIGISFFHTDVKSQPMTQYYRGV